MRPSGGDCQTCGRWFETQRYEDQGYGDCYECEEKERKLKMPLKGPVRKFQMQVLYTAPVKLYDVDVFADDMEQAQEIARAWFREKYGDEPKIVDTVSRP